MAQLVEENVDALPILFQDALKTDNHEQVTELLLKGVDVNHNFKSGVFFKYPVHISCEKGSIQTLKVLIREKADLECGDQWGQRPLHYCVKKRQHIILKCLLANGVEVNAQDGYRRSALFYAVELGDEWMVELLLDSGATVNYQDQYGQTPVHVAASRSIFYLLLERMLAQADVKVDLFDRRKRTPLQVRMICLSC
jgi:ankyrin repeat protein